ncbi:MAG: hypothetical protein HFJ32_00860 [Clostridia bacterium]|nr:hypothetical protein [Clostridia bacterium]
MSNIRVLTKEEKAALNPIAITHGVCFSGGSRVETNGEVVYYVGVDAPMATFGDSIGRKVKKALNAPKLVINVGTTAGFVD